MLDAYKTYVSYMYGYNPTQKDNDEQSLMYLRKGYDFVIQEYGNGSFSENDVYNLYSCIFEYTYLSSTNQKNKSSYGNSSSSDVFNQIELEIRKRMYAMKLVNFAV